VIDEKFDILRHPNVRGTTDGKSEAFRHGIVTGSVASVVFDETIDPAMLPELAVPDGDYEVLSEEDLEELFYREEKSNENENHLKKLPLTGSIKKGLRAYVTIILAVTLILCSGVTASANDDPLAVVNNLSNFIFGLIRAIGLILIGFGIVQVGMALKSHDPSQRANGFLTLAGGIIITFAKEILGVITG
jgi:hypothetical protein